MSKYITWHSLTVSLGALTIDVGWYNGEPFKLASLVVGEYHEWGPTFFGAQVAKFVLSIAWSRNL